MNKEVKTRNSILSAVYLLLHKESKILLMKRASGWMDGYYSLPAGHLDGGETIVHAMLRETYEEIGINVDEKKLRVIHVMHRLADKEYIDFFLTAESWIGVPKIREPNKCSGLEWFSIHSLPSNIVPHVKKFLETIEEKNFFSESND